MKLSFTERIKQHQAQLKAEEESRSQQRPTFKLRSKVEKLSPTDRFKKFVVEKRAEEKQAKIDNPYSLFSRDPVPEDLKFDNWQKAARKNLQLYPDNPKRACYLGISLSTTSSKTHRDDDNYSTNHQSLLGAVSNAILCNCIPPDLSHPSVKEFKDHILSQYAHDNGEEQFAYAWGNVVKKTREEIYTEIENGGIKPKATKATYDEKLLNRFDRTPVKDFISLSPVPKEELSKVTPESFLAQVFPAAVRNYAHGNSKKAKLANVCVQERVEMPGVIFDIDEEEPCRPYGNFEPYKDLSTMRFMSRCLFKEKSNDGGRRNKDNIAKEHLIVVEADFTLPNGEPDLLRLEKMNSVMMIARKYFPMVYVAFSGGKSYHFGFAKNDISDKHYEEILRDFVQHGADHSVLTDKTKLVRLPNVAADPTTDRGFQELLYFDPDQVDHIKARKWDIIGFKAEIDEKKEINIWHNDTSFYVEASDGRWIKTGSVEDHLAELGFSKELMQGQKNSACKVQKLKIEREKSVNQVVEKLGGYDSGIQTFAGGKILIRSNRIMPPVAKRSGSVEHTLGFIRELLDTDIQYHVMMGWLSDAFKCYYNNGERVAKFSPSQMMHIVGEANSGKTSFNLLVMEPLFGGSVVDGAALFIKKETHFNSSEQSAAILCLDDDANLGTNEKERHYQSEVVKSLTVGSTHSYHAKNVDKISVRTYKRIIRYMNVNAIPSLPLINESSVGDKVIVLKASSKAKRSLNWYDETKRNLEKELAAFTHYLLHVYQCPEEYLQPEDERRFPVISYHNPELLSILNEGSKSEQLSEMIKQGNLEPTVTEDGVEYFEGTATQAYNNMRGNLRGDDLDRFKRMYSSPSKFTQSLRELRILGISSGDQKVWYTNNDSSVTPTYNKDGHHYWRIQLDRGGHDDPKPTPRKFFGSKKPVKNDDDDPFGKKNHKE